jgi:peptide/nickel transport system substrate-binding protein
LKKTLFVCLAVLLICSFVLCSCSSSSTAISQTSTTSAMTSTASTKPSATTASAGVVTTATAPLPNVKTTTLPTKVTMAFAFSPSTMDATTSKMPASDSPIIENIFEPIVGHGYNGEADPDAGVATWTVSDDAKVYTFTLRKGIKFHSGDPMTTADVVFSHERYIKASPSYPSNFTYLDKIEVVDDYVIKFIFKEPNPMFLVGPRVYVASKSYYDRVGEEQFVNKPVGTGPYKFIEWKPGEYLDLEANADYWGTKPPVKQAHILFATEETTRVAMLQAGEVDVITSTPMGMVELLGKAGFTSLEKAALPDYAIKFQTRNPNVPWYNKNVRKAIAYAIDREAIVKNLYYGLPNIFAWLAPWELGYDPSIDPYGYNIGKSRALLAEAGYPNGFEMPLYYESGLVGIRDLVDAVTLYLKAVSITCKPTGMTTPQINESMRKNAFDISASAVYLCGSGISSWPDPVSGLSFFLTRTPNSLYSSTELDTIIDKATKTIDGTQKGELIKQAYQMINEAEPQVQILSVVTIFSSKPNVEVKPTKISFAFVLIKDIKFK